MIYYTLQGKCLRLADVPVGARVDFVNDRACVGYCENCGRLILAGTKYKMDAEGIIWHKRCRRAK